MNPFLVRVRFDPALRASSGRLVTSRQGAEVHAASFLSKRLIVLDSALLENPAELKRIWIHELFHFVWWRLSNDRRIAWERLLSAETQQAPGELGWSAEWRKRALSARDRAERTRRWREYCCESFCDSAAWLLSGAVRHQEFTLPSKCRALRRKWFRAFLRYNRD